MIIDLDAIKRKADKFRKLEELLSDADVREELGALVSTKLPEPPPTPEPTVQRALPLEPVKPSSARNVGAQAQLMRLLFTGAVSVNHLAAASGLNESVVWNRVASMMERGMAAVNGDVVSLTVLGRERAKVLVDNPQYKIFPGGPIAQGKLPGLKGRVQ